MKKIAFSSRPLIITSMNGRPGRKHKNSITHFQRLVYEATRKIPRGRVSTYKIIAARLNCASGRAVGQALRRNPFAPKVPCHRVIAANLTIGGFQGCRQGAAIRQKRKLLAAEGVFFRAGRLANPGLVYRFNKDLARSRKKR